MRHAGWEIEKRLRPVKIALSDEEHRCENVSFIHPLRALSQTAKATAPY